MDVLGYTEGGSIRVILDGDENESFVPDDMGNRHRFQIWDEWEMGPPDPETGERERVNTIPPYVPPSPELNVHLADLRWRTEIGGIEVNSLPVATDDRSKIMLSGARIKADKDPAFTTKWKGPDGTFITIGAATIIAVSDAVLDHVDRCFAAENAVAEQIRDGFCETVEQVEAAFQTAMEY